MMIGKKHGRSIVNKLLKENNKLYHRFQALFSAMLILMLILSGLAKGLDAENAAAIYSHSELIKTEAEVEAETKAKAENEDEDKNIIVTEVLMSDACVDEKLRCLDSKKKRIINKIPLERDCWKYEYIKSCNKIPSKQDCNKIPLENFNLKQEKCLTVTKINGRDFCLNMKKTFSRLYNVTQEVDKSEIIMDPDNKDAIRDLLCEAFCLDGDCSSAFKAVGEPNDELASAVAQLEMLSNIKRGMIDSNIPSFNIFGATVKHCHNKKFHSNCCAESGWVLDANLAECPVEAKELSIEKQKSRCEFVGEYCAKKEKLTNICIRETKSYCCFPTVLAKIIHRAARNQLGKSLGNAEDPKCGGLTLDEIERIDFSQVDFQEFFNLEVQPMMKIYDSNDSEALMRRSFPSSTRNRSAEGLNDIDPSADLNSSSNPNHNYNDSDNAFPNISEDGINKALLDSADEGEE